MNTGQLQKIADGRLVLSGELSMTTVPGLIQQSDWSDAGTELSIDLQAVERADSAGVALLVEWQRAAKRQNQTLHFQNIPSQMLAIARLCGVDELLALN